MMKRQCSPPEAVHSTSAATSGSPKLSSHHPDEYPAFITQTGKSLLCFRFRRAAIAVERRDQIEELHRHRGRAHKNVSLPRDGDRALPGVHHGAGEVARHVLLRPKEDRRKLLRNADGLETVLRHRPSTWS